MIRHVVLVRIRPDVEGAEVDRVFDKLRDLERTLTGILAFATGPNVSPEGLGRGYTHAFTVDFEDVAARGRYLADADHAAAGAALTAVADGGVEGILVVDFEA